MKLYGETRVSVACGDYRTNANGWTGRGHGRRVARSRAKDKKLLHRRARRGAKVNVAA